jgi:hypothetical protein
MRVWRPEERDSSLGGRYFNAKRDPSSIPRDFLKSSASLGQLEPPTVASNIRRWVCAWAIWLALIEL